MAHTIWSRPTLGIGLGFILVVAACLSCGETRERSSVPETTSDVDVSKADGLDGAEGQDVALPPRRCEIAVIGGAYVNGTIDARVRHTFEDGLLIAEEHDGDGDGYTDWLHTFSYDDAGRLLQHEIWPSGGTPTFRMEYSYGPNGELRATEEYDADGFLDLRIEYLYDPAGNLLREAFDQPADGSADYRRVMTYDADNNRLSYEEAWWGNGAWVCKYREDYTYDANGKRTSWVTDTDCDGGPNLARTFDYTPDGLLSVEMVDHGGDGDLDYYSYYSYDEDRLVAEEHCDATNTPTRLTTWTYDVHGNLTKLEATTPDKVLLERRVYTYDPAGNLLTWEQDGGFYGSRGYGRFDGDLDWRESFAYDEEGRLVFWESDMDADEVADERLVWELTGNCDGVEAPDVPEVPDS